MFFIFSVYFSFLQVNLKISVYIDEQPLATPTLSRLRESVASFIATDLGKDVGAKIRSLVRQELWNLYEETEEARELRRFSEEEGTQTDKESAGSTEKSRGGELLQSLHCPSVPPSISQAMISNLAPEWQSERSPIEQRHAQRLRGADEWAEEGQHFTAVANYRMSQQSEGFPSPRRIAAAPKGSSQSERLVRRRLRWTMDGQQIGGGGDYGEDGSEEEERVVAGGMGGLYPQMVRSDPKQLFGNEFARAIGATVAEDDWFDEKGGSLIQPSIDRSDWQDLKPRRLSFEDEILRHSSKRGPSKGNPRENAKNRDENETEGLRSKRSSRKARQSRQSKDEAKSTEENANAASLGSFRDRRYLAVRSRRSNGTGWDSSTWEDDSGSGRSLLTEGEHGQDDGDRLSVPREKLESRRRRLSNESGSQDAVGEEETSTPSSRISDDPAEKRGKIASLPRGTMVEAKLDPALVDNISRSRKENIDCLDARREELAAEERLRENNKLEGNLSLSINTSGGDERTGEEGRGGQEGLRNNDSGALYPFERESDAAVSGSLYPNKGAKERSLEPSRRPEDLPQPSLLFPSTVSLHSREIGSTGSPFGPSPSFVDSNLPQRHFAVWNAAADDRPARDASPHQSPSDYLRGEVSSGEEPISLRQRWIKEAFLRTRGGSTAVVDDIAAAAINREEERSQVDAFDEFLRQKAAAAAAETEGAYRPIYEDPTFTRTRSQSLRMSMSPHRRAKLDILGEEYFDDRQEVPLRRSSANDRELRWSGGAYLRGTSEQSWKPSSARDRGKSRDEELYPTLERRAISKRIAIAHDDDSDNERWKNEGRPAMTSGSETHYPTMQSSISEAGWRERRFRRDTWLPELAVESAHVGDHKESSSPFGSNGLLSSEPGPLFSFSGR